MRQTLDDQLDIAQQFYAREITHTRLKQSDDFLEAIALEFAEKSLVITVNPDLDTLLLSSIESQALDQAWTPAPDGHLLRRLIGQELAWFWLWTNSKGYQDGFALAVGRTTTPCLAAVASASSITLLDPQPPPPLTP